MWERKQELSIRTFLRKKGPDLFKRTFLRNISKNISKETFLSEKKTFLRTFLRKKGPDLFKTHAHSVLYKGTASVLQIKTSYASTPTQKY